MPSVAFQGSFCDIQYRFEGSGLISFVIVSLVAVFVDSGLLKSSSFIY